MNTRNSGPKKLRKYDKTGSRQHSVESLNIDKLGKNFTVISRHFDPNYCNIVFNSCGHEKLVTISSILNKKPICYDCVDLRTQEKALSCGCEILAKIKHGCGKGRYETRLARCICCGTFKFIFPSSLKNKQLSCGTCNYNEILRYIDDSRWRLLNRVDKSNVMLECKLCTHEQIVQVSNLKRYTPICKGCNTRHEEESFVYGFVINSKFGKFIKIGKSNNPYLRHLRFTSSCDELNCEFIGKLKFKTQLEAFKFEKELFKRFQDHRVSSDIGKQIINNGWTELFSEHIEDELRCILNGKIFIYT